MIVSRSILGPLPRIGFSPVPLAAYGPGYLPVNPNFWASCSRISLVAPDLISRFIEKPYVRSFLGGEGKPCADLPFAVVEDQRGLALGGTEHGQGSPLVIVEHVFLCANTFTESRYYSCVVHR